MSDELFAAVCAAQAQDPVLREHVLSPETLQDLLRRVAPWDAEIQAKQALMGMTRLPNETLMAASQRATIAIKDLQQGQVPVSSMDQVTLFMRLTLPQEKTAFLSQPEVGRLADRHSDTPLALRYDALCDQWKAFAVTSIMAHSRSASSKPSSTFPGQPLHQARAWQTVAGHGGSAGAAKLVKTLAAASPGPVTGASGGSVGPDDGVSSGSGAVAAVQLAKGSGEGLVYCYTGNFDDDKRETDRRWAAKECLWCIKDLHFRYPERPAAWPCAIHKDFRTCPSPQAQPYPQEVLGGR